MTNEKIWYKDIKVLFEPRKIKKFLPLETYSKSEKLNSVMRLTLYITILLLLTTLNINYLYILIITGLITFLIYSSNEKEKFTNNKELEIKKIKEDPDIIKRDIKVEDYIEECTLPTDHNPFMNFLVSDKREKKEACKSHNNPEIKELIEDKFNKKLYRDINSVYNNENSQREFYTMPNTEVMNKQKELGNWLYKTPKTCKEGNGNQCVGNNMERLNGSSYYFI